MRLNSGRNGKLWLSVAGVVVIGGGLAGLWLTRGKAPEARAQSEGEHPQEVTEVPSVKVIKARPGGIERLTTQPGTVRAFEYQAVDAKVSGFLKNQSVDIGSEVKKGQVVAEIAAPELLADEQHAAAALKQAESQIDQMKARVLAAQADLETAKLLIAQKAAEVRRAEANLHYRDKAYQRVKALVAYKSVDQRLVDEQFDQYESAQAWKDAAAAGVQTAIADIEAKKAKVVQAEADVEAAKANRDVAQANLTRAKVYVEYTKIRSEYDGVVTARNYHDGDFIKAAERGSLRPLLVIQRQDKMRLIIQVPDTDGSICNKGDPVDLSISTVPDVRFKGLKVARVANSQDQKSRTMRAEADIPNPANAAGERALRDGMYGDVTIHLQEGRKDAVRVPSAALRRTEGKTVVFIVRDGVAHQVVVRIGIDDCTQAEVLAGVRPGDLVVVHPGQHLHNNDAVRVTELNEGPRTGAAH